MLGKVEICGVNTAKLPTLKSDEMTELLRRIASDGTRSVLFSTHITSDLEKCASHITFIQEGRLQRSDTLAGFMAHYADLGSTLEEIIVAAERRPYDADAII